MINLLLGVLLLAAPAQTTPQNPKSGSPRSMTASATKPKAMSSTTVRSNKPIPSPSRKDNLESKDNAIPSYKKAKDNGVSKGRNRYSPRRTASGARKDTLIDRRPKR